jgi:regulator of cell morphogenesis and NO signaling
MNLSEKKVADVVASNIKTAHVFKKHGIDFCCGGGVSIEKACEKKNVDINTLLQDLQNIDSKVLPSQNFNNWELDFLVDYIVNTHHTYVVDALELIEQYATKVAKVHGDAEPAVVKIHELFQVVAQEMTTHMFKEEKILFPYIKNLVASQKQQAVWAAPHFVTVANPINMMEYEHETVGDLLKQIAVLSNNYTPPDWACNTFKALYSKLDEFEQDLHIHVHLENNILFPKAIQIEKSFQN